VQYANRLVARSGGGNEIGRVDVSEPASISSGIAARYALAVFELAKDQKAIDKLETDIADLSEAVSASEDLVFLINSPIYNRDAQTRAIAAIAKKMGLLESLGNTLGLMATKRRLFVLPALLVRLELLIADHKGEVSAEVTSAKALTKTQSDKLSKAITVRVGKAVKIKASVDEDIIGGLIVKVGSKMIDTSIRSKLNSLQNVMKEVG
jgi:F-type H+-transporting ATPase subunit delta